MVKTIYRMSCQIIANFNSALDATISLTNIFPFSCRRRNHRSSKNNLNSSNIQEKPGSQHKSLLTKGREHNINGYVHSHSNASNATNSSLLKRRIIFSILAVCITLSKTSVATTETEISNLTPPHSDLGMKFVGFRCFTF